jgi:peptide-methionine (S)-S-oxide reductase
MTLKIDPWSFPDPEPVPDAGDAGGEAATANYDDVCTGRTGHAEAIEIRFDPARIPLGQILRIFFSIAHDPTQVDRQGADVGTQYRSAIFFANDAQRRIAEGYIAQIDRAAIFDAPVATTLEPLVRFYEAEPHHHGYAARNPWQSYIRAVSTPKVEKLRKTHAGLLKDR